MDQFRKEHLPTLLKNGSFPCISLYLPTQPGGSPQDPVRWKNLLREAEQRLGATGARSPQVREWLAPAQELQENKPMWRRTKQGLACFIAPDRVHTFSLPFTVPARAVVASRFQVTPLLPLLELDAAAFVLCVSQNRVRLARVTRHSLQDVDLGAVPKNLAEALRFHDTDEPLLFHSLRQGPGGRWAAIFHGHGVGIDDHKDDLLRYFQQIDRGLHDYLRDQRLPLILASVEYLWPLYRQANTYAHLLAQGIPGNSDRMSDRELLDRAWSLLEPQITTERRETAAQFARLSGTGRTLRGITEALPAAVQGNVESLFVARDKEQWGIYDDATHRLELHPGPESGDDDLLNLAVVHTLEHQGAVMALPVNEMPADSLIAGWTWLPGARRK